MEYRADGSKLSSRLSSQLQKLLKARDRDLAPMIEKFMANPDHQPDLLTALWSAAHALGALREAQLDGRNEIQLRTGFGWLTTEGDGSYWYMALAADPERFRTIVREAIKERGARQKPLNVRRRLRDLVAKPTPRRLANLIRDLDADDPYDLEVGWNGFGYAGRKTGIFPNGLPSDWQERIAGQPDKISALALEFLELLNRAPDSPGPSGDHALERFANAIAAVYEKLSGREISYARGSVNVAPERQGKTYGKGLDVMLHGLRLADSSAGISQAQYQMDRIRGFVSQPAG
ncbi:MAG: hypothetical protein ACTSX7_04440 [Alphaproteobacteria bacterium]